MNAGGKGLPVVLPVSEAPFEAAAKLKQSQMQDAHRIRRGGAPAAHRTSAALSAHEQLAEQITREINERREYVEEMKRGGGLPAHEETRLRSEISQRLAELKRLDA